MGFWAVYVYCNGMCHKNDSWCKEICGKFVSLYMDNHSLHEWQQALDKHNYWSHLLLASSKHGPVLPGAANKPADTEYTSRHTVRCLLREPFKTQSKCVSNTCFFLEFWCEANSVHHTLPVIEANMFSPLVLIMITFYKISSCPCDTWTIGQFDKDCRTSANF